MVSSILQIFDVYETSELVSLVLEIASGGMLLDSLDRRTFSEADAAYILRQIAGALAYLHGHRIIHGDIKLDNVLLATRSTLEIKLADFGMAQTARCAGGHGSSGVGHQLVGGRFAYVRPFGTREYLAPELLRLYAAANTHDLEGVDRSYDETIDVWAAGIVLCELVTGRRMDMHPLLEEIDETDELIEALSDHLMRRARSYSTHERVTQTPEPRLDRLARCLDGHIRVPGARWARPAHTPAERHTSSRPTTSSELRPASWLRDGEAHRRSRDRIGERAASTGSPPATWSKFPAHVYSTSRSSAS